MTRGVRSLARVSLALACATAAPALAQEAEGQEAPLAGTWVAPSHVDGALEGVAEGYAEFVRQQLGRMGVAVLPGAETRKPGVRPQPGPDGVDVLRELAPARRAGALHAVLLDLRSRSGFVEIDVRVHELEGMGLVSGALGVGTLATLAATTNPVLMQVLPALDASVEGSPPGDALPGADQMSAVTRAVGLADGQSFADAWRELEGLESPFVSAVRKQIQTAASAPGVSLAERARFAIAQGSAAAGWQMLVEGARDALGSDTRDVPLLLAAGEAKLALGDARSASAFFQKSVALAPESPVASLGLARSLVADEKVGDARKEFERAASLAPNQATALTELASISSRPSEKAGYLLEAGRRSSRSLRPEAAAVSLDRAVQLDPSLAAPVSETRGELQARIGEHSRALQSYREAIEVGQPTADRLKGVARAQSALRDVDAARATYLEVLEIDHNDVAALHELGDIYAESGDPALGVVRLERAQALAPSDADVERTLAKALHKRGYSGDLERARELFTSANGRSQPTAEDLLELAELQRSMGDADGAVDSLERALRRRHLSMYGRQRLAEAYEARGDHRSAEDVLSVVQLVSGNGGGASPAAATTAAADEAVRFDALLDSFVGPDSHAQQVAFLGLQTGGHWRDLLVAYLHPRMPNTPAIETGLLTAIDRTHTLVGVPAGALEILGPSRDDLFRFDDDVSRSGELITFANLSMETDAVFLGRLLHPLGSLGAVDACGRGQYYVLELRKLAGTEDANVSLLANRACVEAGWGLAGSEAGYSTWNAKAIPAWLLLLALMIRPLVRGWGRVQVFVRVPQHGRALFSVSISRRPKKYKEDKKDSSAPAWRFEKRLQSKAGRRLKGNSMMFSLVAARRKPYYVTIRGPLLDLATDKLIGEFLEEKTIRVLPWRTNEVKFDLRPETAAITVKPVFEGALPESSSEAETESESDGLQARVALKGDPQSVRFTSGGTAYVYASPGDVVVVVGALDRVVEVPLEIKSAAPIELRVDLTDFDHLVFMGCEAAVAPYVECDYAAAATALEAAGDAAAARRVRAMDLTRRGDTEAAARVLEDGGLHAESVQLRRSAGGAANVSGELLEQAGEHARAGEIFEAQGDLVSAARNFEAAYDYQRALDCYETLGETEKVLTMLEALGELYEAGRQAAEADQVDRAIANLQQIDHRHGHYSEACRLLAEMLVRRGEIDVAVEKYAEAMSIWAKDAPLEMQQRYAELLEQADRDAEALRVYETIRKRDVHFGDVATRIEVIKKNLSTAPAASASETRTVANLVTGATAPTSQIGDENSRYEILQELGRGGMGVVFKARDRNLGRVVALKVLPDNLRQHPQAVKLFLREARAAAALNHQNIVTLFDAGQEGDAYFLTMECLEGAGLESILASRGPLSTKAAATVGLQVAAGLDYAQRSKIVHRDIKPSNLFLTRDRTVKIMDFGLAKMVEEVRRGSTVIGGTPNFMAPEQATGGDVDHRTDLYALGGTLFELVTGTVPYESGDVVYHHVHTPPPDARERNVEVPAAMADLIRELMAKDPNDRIQSARDLAARLQQILKG